MNNSLARALQKPTMKRSVIFLLTFLFAACVSYSQQRSGNNRQRPLPIFTYTPGYINITELGGGFGLGDVSPDYSKYVFSLNTVNGYLINNDFLTGIGTGINIYNGGAMIPLYLDFRYTFLQKNFEAFVVADGGLMINLNDVASYTGLFIHPGIGARKVVSHQLALQLSTGPMAQMGSQPYRSTFWQFKFGVLFTQKYVLRSPKSTGLID